MRASDESSTAVAAEGLAGGSEAPKVGSIGVALSGGGHRATVWALGALLYLADAGKSAEVTGMASVSGGSIANGYVAHALDFRATTRAEFRQRVAPLLRHIAHDGLFAFGPATNGYLIATLALGLATAAGLLAWIVVVGAVVLELAGVFDALGWRAPAGLVAPGWLGWYSLALLAALAGTAVLFVRRSAVVDRAMARVHFSSGGTPTRLADVARSTRHVFCAAELQSGDHLYFSPEFVYGYRFGVGEPGPLTLATAVQCSACLPGAFRPRRLRTEPHRFRRSPGVEPEDHPRAMVLSDGGVYDNMADQWHQGLHRRAARLPELVGSHPQPSELIVVNASAGWTWSPIRRWGLLRGELSGLLRAKSVMYDATTAQRRSGLVGRFDRAELQGEGLRGALVHIPQSPWRVAEQWARATGVWKKRATRAREVLRRLEVAPMGADDWKARARNNAGVSTTLGRLGEETTLALLHHAYVLAMCNLHVILDYPLFDVPSLDDFRPLVERAGDEEA